MKPSCSVCAVYYENAPGNTKECAGCSSLNARLSGQDEVESQKLSDFLVEDTAKTNTVPASLVMLTLANIRAKAYAKAKQSAKSYLPTGYTLPARTDYLTSHKCAGCTFEKLAILNNRPCTECTFLREE